MKTSNLRFRTLPLFFVLIGLVTITALSLTVKSRAARGAKTTPAATEEAAPTRNVARSATTRTVLPAAPPLVLNVDTTLDVAALSACTGAPADCSLRGAIITANANPGSTINVPAGTYLLTTPGAGEQLSATGDLDVRATGTSIVGAGAASTIIQQAIPDRVFETNPVPQAVGFTFSISGVTIKDGNTTAAGGGMIGGGSGAVTTITNCVFDNNRATGALASNGGAISFTSANTGDLIVSGTSFTNNITNTGVGGAIRFSTTGTLTVTTSNFVGNRASTNSGGALNVTGPGAGGTYNVSQSNFFNNQALGAASRGGAALLANGLLNISYSRVVSNISGSGIGTGVANSGGLGTLTVNNDWWGQNSGPAAGTVFGTTPISWLQLRHVANPNSICANGSTTLTADIFGLNTGGSTAPSNLTGLPPFPAVFSNPVLGTISGASPNFVDGVATATYTAGPSSGSGSADATADNQTVTASISIESNTTSAIGNQAVCAGATATFSTTASGAGPFSFVWKKGATVLNNGDLGGRVTITSGGSSSSLSISNVGASDADTYTVEATGACSTTSSSGTLTVNAATTATDPADQTVCQGTNANFSTTAGGTGPFSYAWTVDGNPFGGNTSSISVPTGSLTLGNHAVSVTVTGACGSDTQNATLTVQENTSASDPADATVCQGATASFSTTASGTAISYAWTLDGSPFGGNTSSINVPTGSLSIGNHTIGLSVSGTCGTVTQSAALTVQENTSASDPADQTVCQGATANFSTTASGTAISYAWTLDGSPFGGNTSSISVPTGSLSLGNHTIGLSVSGTCGTVTQSAALTVQENTTTTDPADATVCQGLSTSFSTTAGGTGPFSYAWTVDGSPVGGNSPSVTVATTSLSVGNHTVSVTTTGPCGSASQSATLTVQENTSTTDPADQTVCQGASANFSTTASGTGPFTYAWTLDGNPFGGNTSSISVPTGSLSPGNHTVSVTTSGNCGTASQSATLTVNAPTTTSDPADQTVCEGGTANFSTTAGGTGPFSYAWTVDGLPYNGNSSSITVNTTGYSQGAHSVSVTTTGACGSATQNATLTVNNSPPVINITNSTISVWPPNHQYQTFTAADFGATASSGCDGNLTNSIRITSVTSDEVDNNPGGGDGNTVNDMVIAADCKSVQLRRERDGNLDGRVYTITFSVTDSVGHTTTATAQVLVPLNNSGGGAVNSGPHNTVTGTCP